MVTSYVQVRKKGLIKVEAADEGAPVLALLPRFQPIRGSRNPR